MKSGVNDVTGTMELLVRRVSAMSWVTVIQTDNKGRDDDTQFERLTGIALEILSSILLWPACLCFTLLIHMLKLESPV